MVVKRRVSVFPSGATVSPRDDGGEWLFTPIIGAVAFGWRRLTARVFPLFIRFWGPNANGYIGPNADGRVQWVPLF